VRLDGVYKTGVLVVVCWVAFTATTACPCPCARLEWEYVGTAGRVLPGAEGVEE